MPCHATRCWMQASLLAVWVTWQDRTDGRTGRRECRLESTDGLLTFSYLCRQNATDQLVEKPSWPSQSEKTVSGSDTIDRLSQPVLLILRYNALYVTLGFRELRAELNASGVICHYYSGPYFTASRNIVQRALLSTSGLVRSASTGITCSWLSPTAYKEDEFDR